MKRRSLETRFWKDSYIQALPQEGKFLFLYLLTNEYVNIIHTYQLPDGYIALDTGISLKKIQEYKQKFQKDNKFLFKDGWIRIVNADKYEHYEGELNERAKKRERDLVPSHILGIFNTPIDTPIDTPPIVPNNQYIVINNKYSNREDIKEGDLEDIAEKQQVPVSFVKSKFEDVCNWEDEKPGRMKGRNWRMTLVNWVKRDKLKIYEKANDGRKKFGVIPPEPGSLFSSK